MVTTPPATTVATSPPRAAASTSDSPATTATAADDPFGSVLDGLNTAMAKPATASAGAPCTSPVPAQTAIPGQQLPAPAAPGQKPPPVPAKPQVAAKDEDAPTDKALADEPSERERLDPTLAMAPIPQPVPPPPAITPAQVTPVLAANGETAGEPPADAPPPSPVDASVDRSTTLMVAQAAASPPSARPTGRDPVDDPSRIAPTVSSKPTDDADPAGSDRHGSSAAVSPPPPANADIAASLPTVMPAAPITAAPPADGAARPTPAQLRPIGAAPSASAGRAVSERTLAPSTATPAPTAPEIVAPSVQPTPTIASPGAAALAAPAPTATISKPDAPASRPNSPATQVAQAIVEPVKVMMSSPAQSAATASHVTTIQIMPVELGRVDIRIERTDEGPAKIQLVAERPETLSRLVHDQSQLHQALDQAGIPQAGRMLDFSLAPPSTPDLGTSSSFAGGANSGGSSSGSEQHRSQGTYANRVFGTTNETVSIATPLLRSVHAGIDITA